jgi:hypothetical protein
LAVLLPVLAACGSQSAPRTQAWTLERVAALSPEEVARLGPEDLEAIQAVLRPEFARVEAEAARLERTLGERVSPLGLDWRWPNFDYTVYLATAIPYRTFFALYYGTFSGPDWSHDGCSNAPDEPLGLNFKDPCNHHDFGYRNVPQYGQGRNETYRAYVDDRFLLNLKSVCESLPWWDPRKGPCYVMAYTYYAAVRNFGESHYYSTPQRYP